MELIPVFALIILVATIGTFILSVVAYLMVRIRERKKRQPMPYRDPHTEAVVIAANGSPSGIANHPAQRVTRERETMPDQKQIEYPNTESVSVSHHNLRVHVR